MVLCSPGLPHIVHLYGCLYAGMIAVPAFPPGAARSYDRLDAMARDCGATIVLSDTGDTARRDADAAAGCGSVLASARWLSAEDSGHAGGDEDWTVPGPTAESVAFLQYTSGSTAQPKGVMISHGNLLANARAGHDSLGLRPDTPVVNWARVRIGPAGKSAMQVDVAGSDGGLIASVGQRAVRPVDQAQLEAAGRAGASSLFSIGWRPVTAGEGARSAKIAVLGDGAAEQGERYADLAALERAVTDGSPVPDAVLAVWRTGPMT